MLWALKRFFGFTVVSHKFVPVGEESYAFAVSSSDGNKYFVKFCDSQNVVKAINRVNSLLLQLKQFNFVIPPVEINGVTSFDINKGKIYVYPYIEGTVVNKRNDKFDKGLVDKLTRMMADIHKARLHVAVDIPKEKFINNYDERLNQLLVAKRNNRFDVNASSLLNNNEKTIRSIIEKQNKIAHRYQSRQLNLVVTHGDITGLNIIVTSEGDLKLVDWDDAMFTPPERDVNFLFDNPHFSLNRYLELSEQSNFDLGMKEYYGRQWSLDSIIGNFESLLNDSKSKGNKSDYLEEIEEYLRYYK